MWKLAPVLLEAAANRQNVSTPNNSVLYYDSRRNPYYLPQLYQHSHNIPSGQQSSPLTQCIWTFFWLAILIFIAYPIGLVTCELYVILSPLSACCPCFIKFTNLLLSLAHFPLSCTQNMIQAKPLISM